jgi:hypothetical protein
MQTQRELLEEEEETQDVKPLLDLEELSFSRRLLQNTTANSTTNSTRNSNSLYSTVNNYFYVGYTYLSAPSTRNSTDCARKCNTTTNCNLWTWCGSSSGYVSRAPSWPHWYFEPLMLLRRRNCFFSS